MGPPLAALLLLATPAAADEVSETPPRSLIFGGQETGEGNVSVDVGWLRSGFLLDVGVYGGVDLTLRIDAFLLHREFLGQGGVFAGVRWSASGDGPRLSLGAEFGKVRAEQPFGEVLATALRGEVALGWGFEWGAPYVRAAIRGLEIRTGNSDRWFGDSEAGAGFEVQRERWLFGAEVSAWIRPDLSALPQWRIRAGKVF